MVRRNQGADGQGGGVSDGRLSLPQTSFPDGRKATVALI